MLEPGDTVLFFSDGVIEARSADGEHFGTDRLGDLLARAPYDERPAETARRLMHALLHHTHRELQDDATLLLLRWAGPSNPDR
jgi:serine phosphatase RsbU (regulator of sigma subunit)